MDAKRLVHAFENLIANALQFSQHGSSVTIDTAVTDDSIDYTVRDRGPGFREADLPRVFQPFFTRRRGGTGLGLSIVQRIIEEHGGTVNAENHSEGGALLRVQLPLYNPAA
jgi:signal transduction histidine kinase